MNFPQDQVRDDIVKELRNWVGKNSACHTGKLLLAAANEIEACRKKCEKAKAFAKYYLCRARLPDAGWVGEAEDFAREILKG